MSRDEHIRKVGHDLRAPLNAIVTWGELVKAGQLSPADSVRAGETIVRHARNLAGQLSEALDEWRADAAQAGAAARPVDVGRAVGAAVEAARPVFESRQVSCRLERHAERAAQLDLARFIQILIVLLTDAAANTGSGQTVDVGVTASDGRVEVSIEGGRTPPQSTGAGHHLAHALVTEQGGTIATVPVAGDRVVSTLSWPAVSPSTNL